MASCQIPCLSFHSSQFYCPKHSQVVSPSSIIYPSSIPYLQLTLSLPHSDPSLDHIISLWHGPPSKQTPRHMLHATALSDLVAPLLKILQTPQPPSTQPWKEVLNTVLQPWESWECGFQRKSPAFKYPSFRNYLSKIFQGSSNPASSRKPSQIHRSSHFPHYAIVLTWPFIKTTSSSLAGNRITYGNIWLPKP